MSADTERTSVRFNDGIDGEKYLSDRRWSYEKTPFDNCFFVKGFKRDEDFDNGVYTFQSIGSVAICDVVGRGGNLLDACAAPGGKSVNLADKFDKITACDVHEHRVNLIKEYAGRMGKTNITAINKDSSVFDENSVEKFDTVLCDVPCSGTGVLKDNPDIKLNRTSEKVKELNITQDKILSVCSKYVKKGGYLVYSTCSVLKSENQDIIKKFLTENADFKEVTIDSPLPHERIEVGLNFFPDISYGAGFFVCKLQKVN